MEHKHTQKITGIDIRLKFVFPCIEQTTAYRGSYQHHYVLFNTMLKDFEDYLCTIAPLPHDNSFSSTLFFKM